MKKYRYTRKESFRHAFSGIFFLIRNEANFIIHIVAAILVISAGVVFKITKGEWLVALLAIGMVLSAEAMNTAIEKLCDHFTQETHPLVKVIKDVSAASVLLISIFAAAIGLYIFIPYLLELL